MSGAPARRRLGRGGHGPFVAVNLVSGLLIALFTVVPLLYVGYLSVAELKAGEAVGTFAGAANYRLVLEDASTATAFRNTLYFSTLSVLVATLVGTAIALLLDSDAPGGRVLLVASVLPWAIPEVVNALMWKWIFDSNWGLLNAVLMVLGVIHKYRAWFSDGPTAMHSLILAYSWKLVPFVVIILYTALRSIPAEVLQSARIDGAGPLSLLRHVRLPLVMPALTVAILFCVIFSMRAFDLVYLLTRGGPGEATTVLSYYTYAKTFEFGDFGAGAAVSVLLAGATLVLTVAYWRMLRRLEGEP